MMFLKMAEPCHASPAQNVTKMRPRNEHTLDAFRFTLNAHSSTAYVTYTVDKCAHIRETERTSCFFTPCT